VFRIFSFLQRSAVSTITVAVGLFAVTLQAHAQAGGAASAIAAPKAPPTADSLAAITHRGHLIWQYDYVATAATDSVMARHPAPELLQGYVARQRGERWDVAFGRPSAGRDTFYVTFEARQQEDDPNTFDVVSLSPARADTGYYARAMRAIALATADFGRQNRPYNPVVLERPNGLLWVYLIPAQLRAGVYPLGADVRYLVAADGKSILAKRRLHNELLERGAVPPRSGSAKLEAGMHTAVLDDIPEDTDVFHVLARQPEVPEYIVTEAFIYKVQTNGQILFGGRRRDLLGSDSTKAGGSTRGPRASGP
jgi:hypothetical protein